MLRDCHESQKRLWTFKEWTFEVGLNVFLQACDGQGVECDDLSKSVPHRLIYFNA